MKAIQIIDIREEGFHPAVVFEGWKVAVFNSAPIWKAENLTYLQKHNLSDEVFILLKGQCTLILSEEDEPKELYAVRMEPGKVYNIPKGKWHSHALGEETTVIVVENSDTVPENSPKVALPYPVDLNTIRYFNAVTVDEIQNVMNGDGSERI